MDHCGPIVLLSFGNSKYVLTIHDEATGYTWTHVVPDKSSTTTFSVFTKWIAPAENQSTTKVQTVRMDDAKELKGKLEKFFTEHGIVHETMAPYSSSSNGMAE